MDSHDGGARTKTTRIWTTRTEKRAASVGAAAAVASSTPEHAHRHAPAGVQRPPRRQSTRGKGGRSTFNIQGRGGSRLAAHQERRARRRARSALHAPAEGRARDAELPAARGRVISEFVGYTLLHYVVHCANKADAGAHAISQEQADAYARVLLRYGMRRAAQHARGAAWQLGHGRAARRQAAGPVLARARLARAAGRGATRRRRAATRRRELPRRHRNARTFARRPPRARSLRRPSAPRGGSRARSSSRAARPPPARGALHARAEAQPWQPPFGDQGGGHARSVTNCARASTAPNSSGTRSALRRPLREYG